MPPKKKATAVKRAPPEGVPTTMAQLDQVLRAFLGGEMTVIPTPTPEVMNANIQKATAVLKTFLKMPQSVPALIRCISTVESPADMRQLACVLLTKNIRQFWGRLHKSHFISPQIGDAESIRQQIMVILHSGTAPMPVVHSLAHLAAVLARMDLPKQRFLQLPEWINGALNSENPLHVDAAFRVMSNILLSNASQYLGANVEHYFSRSLHWMQHAPNRSIRVRSIISLSAVFEELFSRDDMTEKLPGIVDGALPVILQVLQTASTDYDFDSIRHIASIFSNLLETDGFEKHLLMTLEGFRGMIKNTEYDFPVRASFAQFFESAAVVFPKIINQPQQRQDGSTGSLLDVYLQVVGDLMVEEDIDCYDISTRDHPHLMATQITECLLQQMPLPMLYPRIATMAFQMLTTENDQFRKGGVFLTMILSDKCPDLFLHDKCIPWQNNTQIALHDLFRQFYASIVGNQASSIFIHTVACIGMSALADNLSVTYMDLGLFSEPLEQTLAALQTCSVEKRYRLICTLAELCDCAKSKMLPWLEPVMNQVAIQLQINDPEQQQVAIVASTNISLACDAAFAPYFHQLLPLLLNVISLPPSDQIEELQSAAFVCLSTSSRTVGIQNWSPELHAKIIELVTHCITTIALPEFDNLSTIDTYIVFLGNIALSFGELPRPWSAPVLTMLTAIYDTTINVLLSFHGCNFFEQDMDAQKLEGLDDDNDDDDNDYGEEDDEVHRADESYYFDAGAIRAKLSAISTLSLMIRSFGTDIYQLQLSQKVNPGIGLSEEMFLAATASGDLYFSDDPLIRIHESIAQQIALLGDQVSGEQYILLVELLTKVLGPKCFGPEGISIESGVQHPLPEEFSNLSRPILRILYSALGDDDDHIVGEAFERICELVDNFGFSIFDQAEETGEFFSIVRDIIFEEAPCFALSDYKEDAASQGEEALEACGTFLGLMTLTMGPQRFFAELFVPEISERVLKFCSKDRAVNFRASWMGVLAEIVERTGLASAPLLPLILPICQDLLEHDNSSIQNNALFCAAECFKLIGMMPEFKATLQPAQVQHLFGLVVKHFLTPEHYFSEGKHSPQLHDNVVSGGLRAVVTFPEILSPAEMIPKLLAIYPLHGDAEEIVKILVEILPTLFTNATEVMRPYAGKTVAQIAIALHFQYHSRRLQDEGNMVQFAKQLMTSFPQEVQIAPQVLQAMHPEAMDVLNKLSQ